MYNLLNLLLIILRIISFVRSLSMHENKGTRNLWIHIIPNVESFVLQFRRIARVVFYHSELINHTQLSST